MASRKPKHALAAAPSAPPRAPLAPPRNKLVDLSSEARLHVGRVARPHGLAGQLKLSTFSHDAPSLEPGVPVQLCRDDGSVARATRLLRVQHTPDGILVVLEGVGDRTTAEACTGLQVCVEAANLPALEPGEFWVKQLNGFGVVDEHGETRGTVLRVEPGAAHDVLVVRTTQGLDCDVPWVDAFVLAVDPALRQVRLRTIPGLLDPEPDAAR